MHTLKVCKALLVFGTNVSFILSAASITQIISNCSVVHQWENCMYIRLIYQCFELGFCKTVWYCEPATKFLVPKLMPGKFFKYHGIKVTNLHIGYRQILMGNGTKVYSLLEMW